MKQVMYEDCNNNVSFLKELFEKIQKLSDEEINWRISNLEFIPIYKGDFYNGVSNQEMEKVYDFQRKALEEYVINISNSIFMELLVNIKTIYEGIFIGNIRGEQIKIKIFDGDIIEIEGFFENIVVL